MTARAPDETILEDLRRVAETLPEGHRLTGRYYDKHGLYNRILCHNHFGSWKQALIEAGLDDQTLYDARVRRDISAKHAGNVSGF